MSPQDEPVLQTGFIGRLNQQLWGCHEGPQKWRGMRANEGAHPPVQHALPNDFERTHAHRHELHEPHAWPATRNGECVPRLRWLSSA